MTALFVKVRAVPKDPEHSYLQELVVVVDASEMGALERAQDILSNRCQACGRGLRIEDFEWSIVCDHDWKDARNKVVQSGEVCFKCMSIRAGNEAS